MYLSNTTVIFFLGRLNTFEGVIPSDSTLSEKQEAIENKTFDKLSDLDISKTSSTEDLIDVKEKDNFKKGDKISKKIIISEDQTDSTTAVKHISGSDEENEKLLASEDSKQDGKIATKKALLDDRESKVPSSRQSEDVQATEEKDKASTKQMTVVTNKESSAEDAESKEDKDLNKHDNIISSQKMQADEKQKTEALTFTERSTDDDKYLDDSARGKSADLSSTESRVSTLNVEENLSPERTSSPRDKKSERIKRDDGERPETETGKPKYIRALNIQKITKTF